jgi:hypothetical protein
LLRLHREEGLVPADGPRLPELDPLPNEYDRACREVRDEFELYLRLRRRLGLRGDAPYAVRGVAQRRGWGSSRKACRAVSAVLLILVGQGVIVEGKRLGKAKTYRAPTDPAADAE